MINVEGIPVINFASENDSHFDSLFEMMGFEERGAGWFCQNSIIFSVNKTPNSKEFAKKHGPSVSSFSFLVDNLHPPMKGIGGSTLEFITKKCLFDKFLIKSGWAGMTPSHDGTNLEIVDHLTHNVYPGNMDTWAKFYEDNFGFKEVHFFDITGESTGLVSRAMSNGKVSIPINEDKSDDGQIAAYLDEYKGEGVQHIALLTNNIYSTVETLRKNGMEFLDVPDTYYEDIEKRVPHHGEDLDRLHENKILIDGNKDEILLQIFTKTYVGPIFFEIIQRKNNNNFGEGNFKALFEAIERDMAENG